MQTYCVGLPLLCGISYRQYLALRPGCGGGGGGEGGGGSGGGDGGGGVGGEHTGVTSAQLSGHARTRRAMRAGVFTGAIPVWQPTMLLTIFHSAHVHELSE